MGIPQNETQPLRGSEFLQQRFAFAKPGPFIALHVAWESPLLREELLRPFAGFLAVTCELQKICIIVKCFGCSRELRHIDIELSGALQLSGLCISIGQESGSSVVIEPSIAGDYTLQIGNRSGEIAHP